MDHPPDVGDLGDVGLEGQGLAAGPRDNGRYLLHLVELDVGEGDTCALLGQRFRDRLAQALPGPCHDGDFPFQHGSP